MQTYQLIGLLRLSMFDNDEFIKNLFRETLDLRKHAPNPHYTKCKPSTEAQTIP